MRQIHIANEKERNAEVWFSAPNPKLNLIWVDGNQNSVQSKKYIKSTLETSYPYLTKDSSDPKEESYAEEFAQTLINGDPEIDIEVVGKAIGRGSRVYINANQKVVFRITKKEKVFLPDGSLKEERDEKYLLSNILNEKAIKWSGDYFKKEEVFNKFLFIRKYQLSHTNGLTYDFLYDMAKDLAEKKSLMLIGSGKGKGPIVINDGGKPFRAFLEGRIEENKYLLLLHLSNMELKPLPKN